MCKIRLTEKCLASYDYIVGDFETDKNERVTTLVTKIETTNKRCRFNFLSMYPTNMFQYCLIIIVFVVIPISDCHRRYLNDSCRCK